MSVQLITTSTRPNTSVLWSNLPNEAGWYSTDTYYKENWHEKGRLLSTTTLVSEDGLTISVTREFVDWQALDDFISDANFMSLRMDRNTYIAEVGIETINIETKEI